MQTFRDFRMNRSQHDVRCCESPADRDDFWLKASESSLDSIGGNFDDDIYAELLDASMITNGGDDEHLRRDN